MVMMVMTDTNPAFSPFSINTAYFPPCRWYDSAGLRSLCHGLTNTRVPTGEAPMAPLGSKVNEILTYIDLRGNALSQAILLNSEREVCSANSN